MVSKNAGLIDQWGQPLRREVLTREIAAPGGSGSAGNASAIGGVRSPIGGYPADGLTPPGLADLLRSADQGEPLGYFELAEQIEERDLHYAGVLATRKRSVSQIEVTVEAASDSAEDVARADVVRDWLQRDELADEMFDILDAIGKGISFTEIIWDSSEGQWFPERLEWRDPRWFTFDRRTLRQPLLRGGENGEVEASPLPAFKFITAQVKAKSGLPVRSGLARLAAWSWMFKAYTQRDWAIFTQTYGQPVRVGKFHEGATREDKATLMRAVANIAGDCAAIVPQSMEIEFVESRNVTAGSDLYEKRADWLDRQVSKAVLGQTTTTDAVSGGHAVAQEHRQVQEDIETADCKALAAVLNRDLVRPWMDLEHGPQKAYPRLIIARPQQEDLAQLTSSLGVLVPLGLRVQASEIRDKLGLADPDEGAEVLQPRAAPAPVGDAQDERHAKPDAKATPGAKTAPDAKATPGAKTAPDAKSVPTTGDEAATPKQAMHGQAQDRQHGHAHGPSAPEQIVAAMARAGEPAVAAMAASVETMLAKACDLGEFRAMLASAFTEVDSRRLATALAGGIAAAQAAGRSDLVDESV